MSLDKSLAATIALNRFGLGARPGDAPRVGDDARGWLRAQLDGEQARAVPASMRDLPDSRAAAEKYEQWAIVRLQARMQAREFMNEQEGRPADAARPKGASEAFSDAASSSPKVKAALDASDEFKQQFRDDFLAEAHARGAQQVSTDAPLRERLVMFWSNHFALSADKPQVTTMIGPFEREAIRPNILGNFADLLLAVEQHPAMLRYLDNAASFGPGSEYVANPSPYIRKFIGKPGQPRRLGLNENLAREILELHTLGVGGGYTQADVIELAKGITGWTVETRLLPDGERIGERGFVWLAGAHEPGERVMLGKRYAQSGRQQGEAMLRDLAAHPATARFLATKLARHFSADDPPPALVARLEKAYLKGNGDLKAVYLALIDSEEVWDAKPHKFKRPEEFLVSAVRATALPMPPNKRPWTNGLAQLGQPPMKPGSPAGWSDRAGDWIGSDGVWKRVEVAEQLGERLPGMVEPMALARDALGPWLQDDTALAMTRAESPQQAVAILLSSPEFQWR